MGMFSFLSDAGKKLFGHGDNAEAIKKEIEDSFTELPVIGLVVLVDDDTKLLVAHGKDGLQLFDIKDKTKTVEGYPAPKRVYIKAKKKN